MLKKLMILATSFLSLHSAAHNPVQDRRQTKETAAAAVVEQAEALRDAQEQAALAQDLFGDASDQLFERPPLIRSDWRRFVKRGAQNQFLRDAPSIPFIRYQLMLARSVEDAEANDLD